MKNRLLLFAGIILLSLACAESENSSSSPVNIENLQTPEAFENSADYTQSVRKIKADMVDVLYKEALEKNEDLKKLSKDILNYSEMKIDSLKEYQVFKNNNRKYWQSVNVHISQLKDSILNASTRKIFDGLEQTHLNEMTDYEKHMSVIASRTVNLNDQLNLMKLFVTQPMMRNYQENEKPLISRLENLIKEYDRLMAEAESFAVFQDE